MSDEGPREGAPAGEGESSGHPPVRHRRGKMVFEKRGRWYVAYVEGLPGVNTQGRTLKEARANLREALQLVLEANRELAARRAGARALPFSHPKEHRCPTSPPGSRKPSSASSFTGS